MVAASRCDTRAVSEDTLHTNDEVQKRGIHPDFELGQMSPEVQNKTFI